jgi:hypothetical protein
MLLALLDTTNKTFAVVDGDEVFLWNKSLAQIIELLMGSTIQHDSQLISNTTSLEYIFMMMSLICATYLPYHP